MPAESTPSTLTRLPWLDELVDYLKTHEDDLWSWFSTGTDREKQAEAVRLDLLRTTYRIDRESQTLLYETADAVAATLGIDAPLTIYQAQQSPDLNASLKFVPGEIHPVCLEPRFAACVEIVSLIQVQRKSLLRIFPAAEIVQSATNLLGPLAILVGEKREVCVRFLRLLPGHQELHQVSERVSYPHLDM